MLKSLIKDTFCQVTVMNKRNGDVGTELGKSEVMDCLILYDIRDIDIVLFLLLRNRVSILSDLWWLILEIELKGSGCYALI